MRKIILPVVALLLAIQAGAQDYSMDVNQYGVEVTSYPLDAEAQDGILVFQNKDIGYKLWFDIRVQADMAAFWGEDSDYNPIGNGVSIRRARFAIKGQINRDWYGELDTDFADGVFELKDTYLRYDGLRNVALQVGNFKENFSMQRNTTSRYLQFIERPMVTYLAPSRHIGAEIKYADRWLWASGGIFWQEIAGLEERTYVEDNNKDFGRGPGHSYTGKVIFRPLYDWDYISLHIGIATSYRTPKSTVAVGDYGGVRYSMRNTTSINRKKYLDTDVIKNVNYEMLYTAELAGSYYGLRAESAYIASNVHMTSAAADTHSKYFWGWYAQAGYLLFGGVQQYDYGGGKFTKVLRGRDWGDIEVCARYEYIDLNSRDIFGGSSEAFSVGVNYYVNNNVKIVLNYQYNNNDRYANGKGKLYVGHDVGGNPTTDPQKVVEKSGKGGVDYSMLALRFEIDF